MAALFIIAYVIQKFVLNRVVRGSVFITLTFTFGLQILIANVCLLIWSADKFVLGASNTARSFSISPLIVGVVIVGLGTSAPEMLVSAIAAAQGKTGTCSNGRG